MRKYLSIRKETNNGKKNIGAQPLNEGIRNSGKGKKWGRYKWTDAKVEYLLTLEEINPKITYNELADKLNKKYPDEEVLADSYRVKNRLDKVDRGKRKKRRKKHSAPYEWTLKKKKFVIKLLKEPDKISNKKIAQMLNKEFPNSKVPADERIIRSFLYFLYKKRPDLRKNDVESKSKPKKYEWTEEKLEYLKQVLGEIRSRDPTTLAGEMNEEFYDEKPFADEGDIITGLEKLYKKYPELTKTRRSLYS